MAKKVFLFDIDGVVIPEGDVFFRDRLIKEHKIESQKTNPFFYVDFYRCLVGKADIYKKLPEYFEEWGWQGSVDDLLDFWFSGERDLDHALLEEIGKLREAGHECYIASNQEVNRAKYLWEDVGLKEHFDGAFFSHQLGYLKDHKNYFRHLSENLSRDFSELIFWDNMKEYVDTARSLGVESYLYTSLENYKKTTDLILDAGSGPIKDAKTSVHVLCIQLFSQPPRSIKRIQKGKINLVFEVAIPKEGAFIFQLHPQKERKYLFEQSARVSGEAFRRGIPTHKVSYYGDEFIPYAWIVYEKIEGMTADSYGGDKKKIWKQIGEYAKLIHQIPMSAYGSVRYWKEKPAYSDTWEEEVDFKMEIYKENRILESGRLFGDDEVKVIEREIKKIRRWKFTPMLIHGNLSLDNVLVDDNGKIVGIIDWDEASGGRVPHQEFGSAFAWWMTEGEQKSFLKGYGFSNTKWNKIKRGVVSTQLLMYLSNLIWFTFHKDDEKMKDMCERVREALRFLSS